MTTCTVCGKGSDAGKNVKIYTGELVSTKTNQAGTVSTTTKLYEKIRVHNLFVCNDCRKKQNMGIWGALFVGLLAGILVILVRNPSALADEFFGALLVIAVVVAILWLPLFWLYLRLIFPAHKAILAVLKEKASNLHGHSVPSEHIGAWSESEYKTLK